MVLIVRLGVESGDGFARPLLCWCGAYSRVSKQGGAVADAAEAAVAVAPRVPGQL